MTYIALGEVKATKIERLKDRWEIAVTAEVGGVSFSGLYEVYPDSVHERWFEPTEKGVTADYDDDDFVVCKSDAEVFWRVDCDIYRDVWKGAEAAAGKIADDLDAEIAEFARERINQMVA